MRPGQNQKNRPRGRGRHSGGGGGGSGGGGGGSGGGGGQNQHRPQNLLGRTMDSNGPDVKIRGTPAHIYEKYLQLARDAHSGGDRVQAENYLQHAEHYYRLIMAAQAQMPPPQPHQGGYRGQNGHGQNGGVNGADGQPQPDMGDNGQPQQLAEEAPQNSESQPLVD